MKKCITVLLIGVVPILMWGCDNFLRPHEDNNLGEDQLIANPAYAEGLLLSAYVSLPNDYNFGLAAAADNAVTNDEGSNYLRMATGEWSSSFNPASEWRKTYENLNYINKFLDIYRKVTWSSDPDVNEGHMERLAGEAYGLRAWYQFKLLQAHAGESEEGDLLGYPIVTKPIKITDNMDLPRDSFSECVTQIIEDADSATFYLPNTYQDQGSNNDYNSTKGSRFKNRFPGLAAKAIKSKLKLLAASPAFNINNDQSKWVEAAEEAGSMIDDNGGLAAVVSPDGEKFYEYNVQSNSTDPDVIWSHAVENTRSREVDNFPPSLSGNGNINPTQDFVESFPMENGYPIEDSNSGYDPDNPYEDRDPRFSEYVLYNGSQFKDQTIFTYEGAGSDGINEQTNSTRTGYYLKKFMYENVNIENPAVNQLQFYTYLRWTNILLNYAEAANEAWGPDGDPNGYGFTARDVINALRERAGITQPDMYLASLNSKDEFRSLIHNERRIELSFEGKRFWDLRRWNKTTEMAEPVNGLFIELTNSGYTYSERQVEVRVYDPYMIYGPIPYEETLRDAELVQNKGW